MTVRIDKWLWSVRVFKTRTNAADACRNNRVSVNGSVAKASREIKQGDLVSVKKMPVIYTLKVIDIISNRQPAKSVPLYMENVTPSEELDKLKVNSTIFVQRDRGTGRPTKKERRDIEELMDDLLFED